MLGSKLLPPQLPMRNLSFFNTIQLFTFYAKYGMSHNNKIKLLTGNVQ